MIRWMLRINGFAQGRGRFAPNGSILPDWESEVSEKP